MQVRHPESLAEVGGECPDRVDLGGESFDCGDGSAFDASRAQAEALADRYGVDVASIAVDEEPAENGAEESDNHAYLRDQPAEIQIKEGVCPWCPPDDRYEGDHVGQHASSAHPDAWEDYKA